MTYNLGIPNPAHTPAADVTPMMQNTNQIATSYNTDHIPLNSGSNAGFSNKTTFVAQGSDPAGQASAGITYSKTTGGHTELFYEGEAGTGKILQVTNQSILASNGEGMMPGGLQIKCGGGTTGVAVTFTTAFPTACSAVVATMNNAPQQINITAKASTGFTAVANPAGAAAFYWIAVGY